MLGGEYRHKLDNKGRVSMPAKFRNELGSSFVVTRGLTEKCLFVFPLKIWDKYVSAYESLSTLTDNDVREFGRLFFGRASDCDVDAQGRINIPQNLREFADLKEDIVIVGAVTRIEIWNSDYYDADDYPPLDMNEKERRFCDKVLPRMKELGF